MKSICAFLLLMAIATVSLLFIISFFSLSRLFHHDPFKIIIINWITVCCCTIASATRRNSSSREMLETRGNYKRWLYIYYVIVKRVKKIIQSTFLTMINILFTRYKEQYQKMAIILVEKQKASREYGCLHRCIFQELKMVCFLYIFALTNILCWQYIYSRYCFKLLI